MSLPRLFYWSGHVQRKSLQQWINFRTKSSTGWAGNTEPSNECKTEFLLQWENYHAIISWFQQGKGTPRCFHFSAWCLVRNHLHYSQVNEKVCGCCGGLLSPCYSRRVGQWYRVTYSMPWWTCTESLNLLCRVNHSSWDLKTPMEKWHGAASTRFGASSFTYQRRQMRLCSSCILSSSLPIDYMTRK